MNKIFISLFNFLYSTDDGFYPKSWPLSHTLTLPSFKTSFEATINILNTCFSFYKHMKAQIRFPFFCFLMNKLVLEKINIPKFCEVSKVVRS